MRGIPAVIAAGVVFTVIAFADDVILPEGKAKTTVENTCSECHGLEQIVDNPMTAEKWRATVNKMVKKGATLSPEEVDSVVEYLSVYFTPDKININKATAKDLVSGLQLSAADADAIVKYRDANGTFKDFAALQKVNGFDPKKLESKKDQISF